MLQPIEVLGAMITPAVLISAAALLLLSTANRLGRVNDRLQNLMAEAEGLPQQADSSAAQGEKHELLLEQLASLLERLLLLRSAVTGMYVTIALLVVTSILGGMYVVFPQLTSIVPISVGLLGAVAFLYSIVLLVREASIAVRVTLQEIAYVRQLLEQQKRARQQRQQVHARDRVVSGTNRTPMGDKGESVAQSNPSPPVDPGKHVAVYRQNSAA